MINWEEQFDDIFVEKALGDMTPTKERDMDDVLLELDQMEDDNG